MRRFILIAALLATPAIAQTVTDPSTVDPCCSYLTDAQGRSFQVLKPQTTHTVVTGQQCVTAEDGMQSCTDVTAQVPDSREWDEAKTAAAYRAANPQ